MTPDEFKQQVLATVAEMLDDTTLEWSYSCGTQRVDQPGELWERRQPSAGRTLVLSVKGGARDLEQDGNEIPTIMRRPLHERVEIAHRQHEQR